MPLVARDMTGKLFHHTEEDVDILHVLALLLPDDPIIVNIGACFGTSALAMLEARPDATIFSVDVQECPYERYNVQAAGLDPARVIRVLGPSQAIDWPVQVDLVFVDGAHDYDGIRDDVQVWRSKVKPGGFLVFHDYGERALPHVKIAIDEGTADLDPLYLEGTMLVFQV